MGAAPSDEILQTAPFRLPRGGSRQIALIPLTRHFFPSIDSPLFELMYQNRMDPSVRYYVRPEGSDWAQDHIPDVPYGRQALYDFYVNTLSYTYPSNAALRADADNGRTERIRPLPCAVVFLYVGSPLNAPEGSVRLEGSRAEANNLFVKVIGAVGDLQSVRSKPPTIDDPTDRLQVRMFIAKSAGDHNMARVMIYAAYLYQHQCCNVIGLKRLPLLPAHFVASKSNIPFLCFLRELRERTSNILRKPTDGTGGMMWLDKNRLYGFVPTEYLVELFKGFTQHYVETYESKLEPLSAPMKQQQQQLATAPLEDAVGTPTNPLPTEDGKDSHEAEIAPISRGKVSYSIKGYITLPTTLISSWCHRADEVYIVCADSAVSIVDGGVKWKDSIRGAKYTPGGDKNDGEGDADAAEKDDAVEDEDDGEELRSNHSEADVAVEETIQVHRGDILTFTPSESATDTEEIQYPCRGRWSVNYEVHLESVLLSLVSDECKNAREAEEDDPRWVRDANGPVHDGSFYIWRFRRGREIFHYGTVPKFANAARKQQRTLQQQQQQQQQQQHMNAAVAAAAFRPSMMPAPMMALGGPQVPMLLPGGMLPNAPPPYDLGGMNAASLAAKQQMMVTVGMPASTWGPSVPMPYPTVDPTTALGGNLVSLNGAMPYTTATATPPSQPQQVLQAPPQMMGAPGTTALPSDMYVVVNGQVYAKQPMVQPTTVPAPILQPQPQPQAQPQPQYLIPMENPPRGYLMPGNNPIPQMLLMNNAAPPAPSVAPAMYSLPACGVPFTPTPQLQPTFFYPRQ